MGSAKDSEEEVGMNPIESRSSKALTSYAVILAIAVA
jgi:hypothetical protein